MKEYYVLSRPNKWEKVAGAKPYKNDLGLDLFIHKSLPGSICKWAISERSCGLAIGQGNTVDAATEDLKDKVNYHGIDKILKIREEAIKRYGHAPGVC
jgi:hypothetical protein